MNKLYLIICLLSGTLFAAFPVLRSDPSPKPDAFGRSLHAPAVTNVRAIQRTDGSKIIDIWYDLQDADNDLCTVSVRMTPDNAPGYGMAPTPEYLIGDVGPDIVSGTDKHIIWNAFMESYQINGLLGFQILANDNMAPEGMVYVPGASFYNGVSLVHVSGFYIEAREITQLQFYATMQYWRPDLSGTWLPDMGGDFPSYNVTWPETIMYCNLRSIEEGLTPVYSYGSMGTDISYWPSGWYQGSNHTNITANWNANGYRLLTEAEWELAARGGNYALGYPYIGGSSTSSTWNNTNSSYTRIPANLPPNEHGLYDMGGNVWEWCWDIYGDYAIGEQINPTGSVSGSYRVLRGGSAFSPPEQCRADFRGMLDPGASLHSVGFRVGRNAVMTQTVAMPVFDPPGGTFEQGTRVTISAGYGGAAFIRYTTDGSEPSEFHGTFYQAPVLINSSCTLKARAIRTGTNCSLTATGQYSIQIPTPETFIDVESGRFYNGGMVVTLSPYAIDSRELTQAEYQRVMGYNPSSGAGMGANYPVNNVSWFDAIEYCNRRSIMEDLVPCYSYQNSGYDPESWPTGWDNAAENQQLITFHPQNSGYHIPTEMQWLFAARGATSSLGYTCSGATDPSLVAWYIANSSGHLHPVASLVANEKGIYDMSGNVKEWCYDSFDDLQYADGLDPSGWNISADRVLRGGSALDNASACQIVSRDYASPVYASNTVGFRIARTLPSAYTIEAPLISHETWSYPAPITVSIYCPVPSASIMYTLDGSTPSETNGSVYTSPLLIGSNATLKAFAFRSGYTSSSVSERTYVFYQLSPEGTVLIPGGTFHNGTADVSISSLHFATTEVSQASYQHVMGYNPAGGAGVGPDFPVYHVSWFHAIQYCNLRSIMEGFNPCYSYTGCGTDPADWPAGWNSDANQSSISLNITANGYRLPTEMEWMYAAQGGILSHAFSYCGGNRIAEVSWFDGNSGSLTHPVGSLAPNELALYDMGGNVWEWCWDYFSESYTVENLNDPSGPETGLYRVMRGASSWSPASQCTPNYRNNIWPSFSSHTLGFRVCQSVSSAVNTVATPYFDLASGTYFTSLSLSIGTNTAGTTIYYTTDGSQPTNTSNVYSGPILLDYSTTVKAFAYRLGWIPSLVTSVTLIISGTVATPVINLASGTYSSPQQVSISCSTPGSFIYYTTDGTIPGVSSALYTGTFVISNSCTIRAVAVRQDWTNSALAVGNYIILYAPIFSIAAGTYGAIQSVSLSCPTAEALIYYTTNGAQPTTSSLMYSAPIEVFTSTTIKAIAWREGYSSGVTEAHYLILIPIPMTDVDGGSYYNGSGNVILSDYMISNTEVTQMCYRSVMGLNPSDPAYGFGNSHPVQNITWFNAVEYCNLRSDMEGFTPVYSYNDGTEYGTTVADWPMGWDQNNVNQANISADWSANGYRLPTEMEWTFAARGGNLSQNYQFCGSDNPSAVSWYNGNSYWVAHATATRDANELGLYDLGGNLWEWCWDYYADGYPGDEQLNPTGPQSGSNRIVRGGSFLDSATSCTPYNRNLASPDYLFVNLGFRVCRSILEDK